MFKQILCLIKQCTKFGIPVFFGTFLQVFVSMADPKRYEFKLSEVKDAIRAKKTPKQVSVFQIVYSIYMYIVIVKKTSKDCFCFRNKPLVS